MLYALWHMQYVFLKFMVLKMQQAADTMEGKCRDWMQKWRAKTTHCLLSEEPSLEVAIGV